jgi:hypothetical protein
MPKASVTCEACDGRVSEKDAFCTTCGLEVSSATKQAIDVRRAEKSEHERAGREASELELARFRRIVGLARAALFVLVLIEIAETFVQFSELARISESEVAALEQKAATEVLVDDIGNRYTVEELRLLHARDPLRALVRGGFAVGMLGALFVWARRRPLAGLFAASLFYAALLLSEGFHGATPVKAVVALIVVAGARAAASMAPIERARAVAGGSG